MTEPNAPITEEERAQWVAALRSGRYQQGRHVLYNEQNNSFCCLGVFADAVRHVPWQAPKNTEHSRCAPAQGFYTDDAIDHGDFHNTLLPAGWVNFELQQELSATNDEGELDFAGIASLIERTPIADLQKR